MCVVTVNMYNLSELATVCTCGYCIFKASKVKVLQYGIFLYWNYIEDCGVKTYVIVRAEGVVICGKVI